MSALSRQGTSAIGTHVRVRETFCVADEQDPDLARRVGAAIRSARVDMALSQAELAKQLEIDIKTVGRIERGEFAPSLSTLMRIARRLERSLDELTAEASTDAPLAKIVEVTRPRFSALRPPGSARPGSFADRADALEDRVDLLTRALRQVLGDSLAAAIAQQEAQDRRSGRKLPGGS